MKLKHIVIALSLSALAGCAGTAEQSDDATSEDRDWRDDCIYQPSVRGYRVLDAQNLLVDAAGRRTYHVVLRRKAYELRSSMGIAFKSTSSRVCEDFSEIVFRDNMFERSFESIRIRTIRLLTPEEEEHLLIQFGKKEPEIEQTPAPEDVKGAEVEELDTADND
ncbi:MAG: DUF6491 family protein [Woeseiaceae bacterium]|nr:DUF6491 family protein [Woeseiaceae bacterium]